MMADTTPDDLSRYRAESGTLVPVWTVEVQTLLEDVDRLLDAVEAVYSLRYGRYRRNASVMTAGLETAVPLPHSTTSTHVEDHDPGRQETYPMVEVKFSVERDTAVLARVMDAVHRVHHYEEPVIYVREAWASRADYNPESSNPHRFWNNGRGLPPRIPHISNASRGLG